MTYNIIINAQIKRRINLSTIKGWKYIMPKKRQVVSEEIRERFASNIRRTRGWMQLTQAELAKKTDLTKDQIAKFERARQNPDVFEAMRIAEALDTSIDELLNKDDNLRGESTPRKS